MREIVLDTETTGLSPATDRVVEIGCVELINHIPSGRRFHHYLKPDTAMSWEAIEVHGLTEAFLADKPPFRAVADDFLAFIGDAPLIAHNATFDLGFVNAELQRAGRATLSESRLVDSLLLARRRHPGAPNSLDALCSRYGIDRSQRTMHGALLDALLLAEVYIELIGGRQANLMFGEVEGSAGVMGGRTVRPVLPRQTPRIFVLSDAETAAHRDFVRTLGREPIWDSYLGAAAAAA